MPGPDLAGSAKRSIEDIKEEILARARERQALIERGEYDVPLNYVPLPLPELLDLLGQLEYRRDALSLAVPPPHPVLAERIKRAFKNAICNAFRWLLIRQVEYNSAAIELLREIAELLGCVDRNQNEFAAALTALKLQLHSQSRRLGQLERLPAPASAAVPFAAEEAADRGEIYQTYLSYLRNPGPVLVIGCRQVELVKLLLSEGLAVQAVDSEAGWIEYCRERDLPVLQMDPATYLEERGVDCQGGIFLDLNDRGLTAAAIAQLLGRAWISLRKGGYLIAEALTPAAEDSALPVELLRYLLESQCFTIADITLSTPVDPNSEPVRPLGSSRTVSISNYRHYAVLGRK
jgi:hypothetical protein